MKKILLTGATGFIGRNLLPLLQEHHHIFAPTRKELDLLNPDAVTEYLKAQRFDAVIHLANTTGHNPIDTSSELFERSLKTFSSLLHCSDLYGKMIYIGSGAEYGKHRNLSQISEDEFGVVLPRDDYGWSRYLMSKLTESYDNIVNLRLFACHGPSDPPHKLIPSILQCIRDGMPISLRQDVWFDFLYVTDIAPILLHFIDHTPKYKAYNLCSGTPIRISEIAQEICRQTGAAPEICFAQEGFNLEYTANNARLLAECPNWKRTSMRDAISKILKSEGMEIS